MGCGRCGRCGQHERCCRLWAVWAAVGGCRRLWAVWAAVWAVWARTLQQYKYGITVAQLLGNGSALQACVLCLFGFTSKKGRFFAHPHPPVAPSAFV